MRVVIRYGAQARQATNVVAEMVELSGPCPLSHLLDCLGERHGEALCQLLATPSAVLLFVNDEQADPADPILLGEGDVVTILSPMAGGCT